MYYITSSKITFMNGKTAFMLVTDRIICLHSSRKPCLKRFTRRYSLLHMKTKSLDEKNRVKISPSTKFLRSGLLLQTFSLFVAINVAPTKGSTCLHSEAAEKGSLYSESKPYHPSHHSPPYRVSLLHLSHQYLPSVDNRKKC